MFNLVRAFFKEKKPVWICKLLRILLRGQPNVPTQEKKHVTPVCDAGIFCRKEKNEREKMKVMQKYSEGKFTLKLCFVFFGLSTHVYCRMYKRNKCFCKKQKEILIKRTSQLRLKLPERNTVKKVMENWQ